MLEFSVLIYRLTAQSWQLLAYFPHIRLLNPFPLFLPIKKITMQTLLVLHSILRWLVLIFAFWTIFSAISGLMSKRNYVRADDKSNFFFMLSIDVQLLIGMILYFSGQWCDKLKHIGDYMKDPNVRFFALEHFLLMLIAWVLVHAGRISVKKAATSQAKFKKQLIYFGIALLIILAAIPWPFREALVRPWVRWF